jgi:hypothetical protein
MKATLDRRQREEIPAWAGKTTGVVDRATAFLANGAVEAGGGVLRG